MDRCLGTARPRPHDAMQSRSRSRSKGQHGDCYRISSGLEFSFTIRDRCPALIGRRGASLVSRHGEPAHDFLDPPEKPSRMRWRTYDPLAERWYAARDVYWHALDNSAAFFTSGNEESRPSRLQSFIVS